MTARPTTRLRACRPARSRAAGFTLLELIVAAGILALVAVFSWRGLDTLIREREAIAASQETLDRMQRSFARIERDALLAGDAQVEDGRALRFVSGTSAEAGGGQAAVEYRLVDGALTRSVLGSDAAPLVLLDGVAVLTIEAWMPAPRGGGWVRNKAPATEAPRPQANRVPGGPGGVDPANPGGQATLPGTQLPQGGTTGNLPGAAPGPNVPGAAGSAPPGAQQAVPLVAAATGIRFAIARADGSTVTRAFVVGGS